MNRQILHLSGLEARASHNLWYLQSVPENTADASDFQQAKEKEAVYRREAVLSGADPGAGFRLPEG